MRRVCSKVAAALRRRSSRPASAAAASAADCCRHSRWLAECVELLLQFDELRVERGALALEGGCLLLEAGDGFLPLRAGLAVMLGGVRPLVEAALDARGLLLHLAEGCAGVGGFALRVAALLGLGVERGGEFAQFAFEGCRFILCLREFEFGGVELALDLGEFALEGERPLRAHLAPGDGGVVEGLAGGAEEEAARMLRCQPARGGRIGRDESVAQLGQHGFQRCAESVENAHTVLERDDALGGLQTIGDSQLPVRILLAVDEEGGATGDVGGEQTDARVGGVPALDDDVVQLVAQELIDDGLVLAVDFEEVGEGAEGRERRWLRRPAELALKMFFTVSVE